MNLDLLDIRKTALVVTDMQNTILYDVVLYELLTGEKPFKGGEGIGTLLFQIANDPHPDPLSVNPALPPALFAREIDSGQLVQPFAVAVDVGGYWLTRLKSRSPTSGMQAFRAWLLEAFQGQG